MPSSRDDRFRIARRDPALTVLEGVHAVKHALRFGAEILEAVTAQPELVERTVSELAPDIAAQTRRAERVSAEEFARLSPRPPPTGLLAVARRRVATADEVLRRTGAPVVYLEEPINLGNIGASVRAAAAAGAAGLLSSGRHDPWHPEAVRAAAGLQYALPVATVPELPPCSRPLVALAIDGQPLGTAVIPDDALLAFGTERMGLSDALLGRADLTLTIPMRPAVASLNLATAVGITLYAWRLASTGSNSSPSAEPSEACSDAAASSGSP